MLLIVVNYSNNNQKGTINFSGVVKEVDKITEEMTQQIIHLDKNRLDIHLRPWEIKLFRKGK
jgi:hypothetical protein